MPPSSKIVVPDQPDSLLLEGVSFAEIVGNETFRHVSMEYGSTPDDLGCTDIAFGAEASHLHIHHLPNVSFWGVQPGGAPYQTRNIYNLFMRHIFWLSIPALTPPIPPNSRPYDGIAGYMQWQSGTPCVYEAGVTMGDGSGFAGKFYTTNTNRIRHARFKDWIFADTFLLGGEQFGADDVEFHNCAFLKGVRLGYQAANGSARLTNCLICDRLQIAGALPVPWHHLEIDHCSIVSTLEDDELHSTEDNLLVIENLMDYAVTNGQSNGRLDFHDNTYFSPRPNPMLGLMGWDKPTIFFDETWTGLGFDANSTFTQTFPPLLTRVILIRDNPQHLANVVAINTAKTSSVEIDLSSIPAGGYIFKSCFGYDDDWQMVRASSTATLDMPTKTDIVPGWDYETYGDPYHVTRQVPLTKFLLGRIEASGESDVTPEEQALIDLLDQLGIDPALVGQFVSAAAQQDPTLEKVVSLTQQLAEVGLTFDRAATVLGLWGQRDVVAKAELQAEEAYRTALAAASAAKAQLETARAARSAYDDQINKTEAGYG